MYRLDANVLSLSDVGCLDLAVCALVCVCVLWLLAAAVVRVATQSQHENFHNHILQTADTSILINALRMKLYHC